MGEEGTGIKAELRADEEEEDVMLPVMASDTMTGQIFNIHINFHRAKLKRRLCISNEVFASASPDCRRDDTVHTGNQ